MLEMQIAIPQTRVFVFTAFPERSGSEEAEFLCLCSLVFTFPFPQLPLVDTTTSTAEELVLEYVTDRGHATASHTLYTQREERTGNAPKSGSR